ncbi:hypothetical protein H5410_004044 [Solanum commersonii]|uniref:Uncharacterized protein n=1 Tax=Solanum commersonii TaxID=4109 RepID=A0A9J6B7C5_SOLCO|nr:hypothetical protein H5410_004044 [Solanum commersonii]
MNIYIKNNMKDLKDLYSSGESSMIIDEIVDIVLGTKCGYIKGLGYGPKPNTTRATQRRTAELEYSQKIKRGSLENQKSQKEDQQSQVQDQQSHIQALNSQLDYVVARQEDMFKKMQLLVRSSP